MPDIKVIEQLFNDNIAANQASLEHTGNALLQASQLLINALKQNNKILSCGNGGSAGDAQHFSSELVNRFEHNRQALPAIALTTESSTLTAIANDLDYEYLFSRQIEALGQPGDVLLAFSTSGNSKNIIQALKTSQEKGLRTIIITGKDGGQLATMLGAKDLELRAISQSTARVQELHLLFIHTLCHFIDKAFSAT